MYSAFTSFRSRVHGAQRFFVLFVAATAVAAISARPSDAQGIGDRFKQKVADKMNGIADSLSDLTIDKATGAAICAATNPTCIKKATGAGKSVKVVDAKGKQVSAADSAKAMSSAGVVSAPAADAPAAPVTQTTGDGLFVNYDFVPGDRVIFAEDFTRDNVGDFPQRLKLRSGNFEVAQFQGQRFLRSNSSGVVIIPLPEALPSRFTFEADYKGGDGWSVHVNFDDPDGAAAELTEATYSPNDGGLYGSGVNSESTLPENAVKPITHIALMADGKYVKTYVNGVRVANVPVANIGRGKSIVVGFTATEDTPAYMSNIRVAAGGKPLYDAIMADGRVATHGILFDTGSDRIRGESKPTLELIGKMLQSHADLKLVIEGHTDNVGNAAANQTLSDKRAAAVRQYLTANYQIDQARLSSKGMGATKPTTSNDTPEGRQQNRRVELVKN